MPWKVDSKGPVLCIKERSTTKDCRNERQLRTLCSTMSKMCQLRFGKIVSGVEMTVDFQRWKLTELNMIVEG
jgi:hypothetical protein